MTKSKKYFLVGAILFLIILLLVAVDIGSRTIAPWEKAKMEQKDE